MMPSPWMTLDAVDALGLPWWRPLQPQPKETDMQAVDYARERHSPDRPDNVRGEVLRLADEAVNGDRNAQYGDPNQDFARTAVFWNEYLKGVAERKASEFGMTDERAADVLDALDTLLDTWDVGQMMTLLKISRSCVSPAKLDHYVDGAGYQACAAHCAESTLGLVR